MIFQNLSRPSCVTFSYNNVSPNVCFASVAVPFYFFLILYFQELTLICRFLVTFVNQKKKKKNSQAFFIVMK